MERLEKPIEPSLLIYTHEYGIISSGLKPDLTQGCDIYKDKHNFSIPMEVEDFCRDIQSLGGLALIVGGSIRDTIIGELSGKAIKPKDFDVEIYGLSSQDIEGILTIRFGEQNLNSVGRSFEVLKLKLGNSEYDIDVSLPRQDSKINDEGHNKAFRITGDPTMNIKEAGRRRDLRVNSMAYNPLTNTLYDPFDGISDIENQVLNITDPELFKDDALRVIRIMQFAARFNFKVPPETINLCKTMVQRGDLDKLSRDRIVEEFTKLLTKGIKPSLGFEFARQVGLTERHWPELHALIGVSQEPNWHPEGDVWTHTMQVVDAAAEIARREKLNEFDTIILVLSALCHDFGKPSTTEYKEGAIRSHGHEQAGVQPARVFIERIFADPHAKQLSEVAKQILPLVGDHLKPKEFWTREVKNGVDQRKAVLHLANRLMNGDKKDYPDGGGTNIYMLSLLAEADQRGRNPKGSPFERNEVPDLDEWQKWIIQKSKEFNVSAKAPEKLLMGREFLESSKLTGGIWLGVILKMVYLTQLDGEINSKDEALNQGFSFLDSINEKINLEMVSRNLSIEEIWEEISHLPDPRTYLDAI